MERITDKHLQASVDRLNRLTNSPAKPWAAGSDGQPAAQLRNSHLSFCNGGVCVHRMHNASGGVSTPCLPYHTTRRETYTALQAFIGGIEFAKHGSAA